MVFESDSNKSNKNKEKHGIDFYEAQKIWNDENSIIIPAKNVESDKRYALIGKMNNKYWICIFAIRNLAYRIISACRCRRNEEVIYEANISKSI